jgi:hypothetical protein
LGLEEFAFLAVPVTAEMLRNSADRLWEVRDHLKELHGDPVLFPFYPYGNGEVRAQQAYLTKFPRELLTLYPSLRTAVEVLEVGSAVRSEAAETEWGVTYRAANEEYSAAQRDPFAVDPALVERGLRGHAATQNALAAFVREIGLHPKSPQAGDPNYDLAWERDDAVYVAEVKSLTTLNQEKQLRLGLGQILRFRHMFEQRSGRLTVGVLALECEPTDNTWMELCSALGIVVVWNGNFDRLTL